MLPNWKSLTFAMAFVTLSLFYHPGFTYEWFELTEVKLPTFDIIFRHILMLLPFVIKDCVVCFTRTCKILRIFYSLSSLKLPYLNIPIVIT